MQWQRAHCVKNVKQLRACSATCVDERVLRRPRARPGRARHDVDAGAAADDEHHGAPETPRGPGSRPRRCTPTRSAATCCRCSPTGAPTGPSHPHATRDSLHEHDMWVAEGLTHRYPTKVLAELLPTCPQYCGHCTRMDLVGNSTPVVDKLKFLGKPVDRHDDDARLPPSYAAGARRRGLRRRRGEHALAAPRVVPHPAAGDRQHPRHPAGHQGADGSAPALAAGRGPRRCRAGRPDRPRPRRLAGDPHPRQPRQLRDSTGRRGVQGDARGRRPRRPQPGRADRGVNADPHTCSTCASRCSTARRSCPTTSTCAT